MAYKQDYFRETAIFFTSPEIVGLQLKTLDQIERLIENEKNKKFITEPEACMISQTTNTSQVKDGFIFYNFDRFIKENDLERFNFKYQHSQDELLENIRIIR